jgi:hypothetical protein
VELFWWNKSRKNGASDKDKDNAVKETEDLPGQPLKEVDVDDIERQINKKVHISPKKVSEKSTKTSNKLTVSFKK